MSKERELLEKAVGWLHDTYDGVKYMETLLNEIDAYLSEPIKEPEPVGYISPHGMDNIKHPCTNYDLIYREQDNNFTPVYTTQPDTTKRIAELERRIDELALIRARLESRIANGVRVYVEMLDETVVVPYIVPVGKDANATLLPDEQGD